VPSARFQPITEVSRDGQYFPTDPGEFRDEVLRQASELYSGRRGLLMDTDRLLAGGAAGRRHSEDEADFQSQMAALLDPTCLDLAADAPPTFARLFDLLGKGSNATSRDELPNSILGLLAGHGVGGISYLLRQLAAGQPSYLLNGVLHIPLRKKEPAWLLANTRPVLLEPSLRRMEATLVFRRQQQRFETRGTIPSCMFAYRKQLSPQIAALLCRWPHASSGPGPDCPWHSFRAPPPGHASVPRCMTTPSPR
jgi:hypothetical protein